MIFTFVLLLQLVLLFNVEAANSPMWEYAGPHGQKAKTKHYLVETKDEKSPEENSPVGQVVALTFLSDQIYKSIRKGIYMKQTLIKYYSAVKLSVKQGPCEQIMRVNKVSYQFLSYAPDAGLSAGGSRGPPK